MPPRSGAGGSIRQGGLGKFDFEGSLKTSDSSNENYQPSPILPTSHSSNWDLALQRELDSVVQDAAPPSRWSQGQTSLQQPLSRARSMYVASSARWLHPEASASWSQANRSVGSASTMPIRSSYLKKVEDDEKHPNLRVSFGRASVLPFEFTS